VFKLVYSTSICFSLVVLVLLYTKHTTEGVRGPFAFVRVFYLKTTETYGLGIEGTKKSCTSKREREVELCKA
jgi:hypothetical protein